jgi:Lysyl oxidase
MGAGTVAGRARLDWKVAGGSGAAALVIAALAVSTGSQAGASGSGQDVGRPLAVADAAPPTAVPTPTPTPTDIGHHPLLPNMDSLKATGVRIVKRGGVRHLLFSSTLVDTGIGPLEIVPQPGRICPAGKRDVAQAIYQDKNRDGRYQRKTEHKRVFRQAGCMQFHPAHNHWHVDASARYWLTKPGDDATTIVKHSKVSFCLRDSIRLPGKTRHSFYGACSRDARQGITPGWGDVYQWFLPGQELILPRPLPRGLYCLHQQADPLDLFRESDETDNDSVRALRIHKTHVTYKPSSRCR